jgi:hypothetical protein
MRKSKPRAVRATYQLIAPQAEDGPGVGTWLTEASGELARQGTISISLAAALCVRVGPGALGLGVVDRRVRELLAHCGVIADASTSIVDSRVLWDHTLSRGRIAVQVWRSSPPESRIKRATRARVAETQRRLWAARRAAGTATA